MVRWLRIVSLGPSRSHSLSFSDTGCMSTGVVQLRLEHRVVGSMVGSIAGPKLQLTGFDSDCYALAAVLLC